MNPPSPHRPRRAAGNAPRAVRPASVPSSQAGSAAQRPGPASSAGGAPVPLWRLLTAVAGALQAIRGGQSGTTALVAVDAGLRPGVQALLFQVLRQAGRAEALRRQLAARAPAPAVDALLCSALALCWDPQASPYEPFTLVNQAVEAAKHHPATRAQASFINGCLRRFLRERDALVAATDNDPVARWNHPAWWVQRLRKDHPQHWEEILQANNAHAPIVLRVNEQKCTVAQYLHALGAINLGANAVGEHGVALHQAVPVQSLPHFAEGWVSVQDAAAQQAAPLLLQGLDLSQPLRVLDACAAPGGKTAHLLECARPEAPIAATALDVDPQRCERIHGTLQRLGLQAQVLALDAGRPQDWFQAHCGGQPFDAILLDAPCTASGIVRRHPDVRWLRRPGDVAQLAAIQARLLDALWPLLAPGGRMLYATCSVFKAEGEDQIRLFLQRHSDAQACAAPGHLLPGVSASASDAGENSIREHDGFFYARLHKRLA